MIRRRRRIFLGHHVIMMDLIWKFNPCLTSISRYSFEVAFFFKWQVTKILVFGCVLRLLGFRSHVLFGYIINYFSYELPTLKLKWEWRTSWFLLYFMASL
jgi:hypothetical protein